MSKSPLRGAALLWAVMLWLLGQMQVSAFTFQTPKLPLKIPLEKAAVSGRIYSLYKSLYQECKSNYKFKTIFHR